MLNLSGSRQERLFLRVRKEAPLDNLLLLKGLPLDVWEVRLKHGQIRKSRSVGGRARLTL